MESARQFSGHKTERTCRRLSTTTTGGSIRPQVPSQFGTATASGQRNSGGGLNPERHLHHSYTADGHGGDRAFRTETRADQQG
eukprot:1226062-Pyramimonas_sp.AAC.1